MGIFLRNRRNAQSKKGRGAIAALFAALVLSAGTFARSAEVSWTRFKGSVKAINYKTANLTIQMSDGDLVSIHVDADVTIREGKDEVPISKVQIDDKITLYYAPKAPEASGPQDTPDANGILPPAHR